MTADSTHPESNNSSESGRECSPSEVLGVEQPKAPCSQVPKPSLPLYYDSNKKEYLIQNAGGRWLSHAISAIRRILKGYGISSKVEEGAMLSPFDEEILKVQENNDVQYSGKLAGKKEGFYEEGGIRFLVTESPKITKPVPGDWPTLRAVFSGLLTSDETTQVQLFVFFGWLKVAYGTLRKGVLSPGQALTLAGPPGCGKSLLQNLITEMLGGRSAKAYRYLSGRSEFNADLFEAEHLMLEDETSHTDIRQRRHLSAYIKSTCVNQVHSCHRKHCTPVPLCPFWRLSISLNDEAESMLVLPPLDEDVADKIILLKCSSFNLPMPTITNEEKSRFWEKLISEIPAFLHYLTEWEIPEEITDLRYGVKTFHHQDLKQAIDNLSPEFSLLDLIDAELWSSDVTWRGTAAELTRRLCGESSAVKVEARKLLDYRTATGTYLGRLATKQPERVQKHRTSRKREWVINAPEDSDGSDPQDFS